MLKKKKKKDLNGFYDIIQTRNYSDNEAVTLLFSEESVRRWSMYHWSPPASWIRFLFHYSVPHWVSMLMSGTRLSIYPDPLQVGQSFQKISKPTRQWILPRLHPRFGQGTNPDIFFWFYLFVNKVFVLILDNNNRKIRFLSSFLRYFNFSLYSKMRFLPQNILLPGFYKGEIFISG